MGVLLLGDAGAPALGAAGESPRAVVIDTDMAPDDWIAILYLLHRREVTIKAITISGAGETHCGPGVRHALGLVALAGAPRIPVACGRETPLQGRHAFPTAWRAGVDRLFGLTLPPGRNPIAAMTASALLVSVIGAAEDKVTVVTLGPLTNVAEALRQHPEVLDRIEHIYVMGGAVKVPGNIALAKVGIDNAVAEWNLYIDPHAANRVFASGAPVSLVPLDATNAAPVTAEFYQHLRVDPRTPAARFVVDLFAKNPWLFETGQIYFWDPLTAALVTDNTLAEYQVMRLCVIEAEGPRSGWSTPDPRCPVLRVAVTADRPRFERLLRDTLNRQLQRNEPP